MTDNTEEFYTIYQDKNFILKSRIHLPIVFESWSGVDKLTYLLSGLSNASIIMHNRFNAYISDIKSSIIILLILTIISSLSFFIFKDFLVYSTVLVVGSALYTAYYVFFKIKV